MQAWQASGQVTGYQRSPRRPPSGGAGAGAGDTLAPLVKIVLDAERCTGHGRCYSLAPELFDSDDDGHSVVIAPEVPAGLEAQARLAVDNCPESCISLED